MIEVKKLAQNLIDMRRPKKNLRKGVIDAPTSPDQEKYPWGIKLNLGKDEIKKLGLKTDSRKIGDKVTIVAQAEISSLSESQSMNGEDQRDMGIQITKMKII